MDRLSVSDITGPSHHARVSALYSGLHLRSSLGSQADISYPSQSQPDQTC